LDSLRPDDDYVVVVPGTKDGKAPFPPTLRCGSHQPFDEQRSIIVRDWNRGGCAAKRRRTADDLHRHFGPTQAKTDASACAWIAVDTKTVPVAVESALKTFLGQAMDKS
jgi:hypothetical protein